MPSRPANPKRTRNSAAKCASRTRSEGSSGVSPPIAAARASRCRRTTARRSSSAEVRYFLDTEYNGIGGALLSLALVPDDGDELYLTLSTSDPLLDWVERHVVPYLDSVAPRLSCPRLSRADA